MLFDWDEAKRQSTLQIRGLDFADLEEHFDWDTAFYRDDIHRGENRTQAIGFLYDTVAVVVFTQRGDMCRIVSLGKAELRERRAYDRQC